MKNVQLKNENDNLCSSVMRCLLGASTVHKRGNGARCTVAKSGGIILMIMMFLHVFKTIYYYMIYIY